MNLRPVFSDEPLELPVLETDKKLTRDFLIQSLGQKKELVDKLLGVEKK